ncbi:multidrug effflux MFS transporter [Roseomonas sp. GC11]|uniref:multidrug effflux MFS transporter n=1 Tax=Roseomonas sp. GC11 TaxID=2950546 RepID=UPI002109E1B2|nr:multidrug effflux MFS transporter [Roseomonas sp. GC11]MCQ4162717.1 multidrug effflux MFS transporter [Roseomonas sp. GC11]
MAIRPSSTAFTLLLGALAALPPLSIDMGLPGFPALEAELGASPSEAAQTLSLFLLGFATGPLLLGPASDRFGRRPVLLAGLVVYLLGGLACTLAGSTPLLLAGRLVQGIGAGAGATLPFAILRDLFEGHEARLRMTGVTMVLNVGPIVAPILGTAVMALGGWRMIYGTLALGGLALVAAVALGFAETAPASRRPAMSPAALLSGYLGVLRERAFLVPTLLNATGFGTMFAYISGSPAVLMGHMGASGAAYSLMFACSALAAMLGSALSGVLVKRGVSSPRMIQASALVMAVASAGLVGLSLAGALGMVPFVALAALAVGGYGLLAPNAAHEALVPMGSRAGLATAALRALQMLAGALSGALVGLFYDGRTALALSGVMLAFALAGVLVLLLPRRAGR